MKRFLFFLAAALCGLALACSDSELVSPDVDSAESTSLAKGKPGPAPTGTIYMYLSGSVHETDPDGGNRRDTGVACCGTPSRELHGNTRWFAVVRPSSGTYPDGRPRQDLFLVNDGATDSVQVTSALTDLDLEVRSEAFSWRPDTTTSRDAYVTFVGRRVSSERCPPDTTSGYYLEGGIYAASVDFDSDPTPTVGSVSLVVSSEPNGRCGDSYTALHNHPRIESTHDWSPDGSRVAAGVNVPGVRADLTVFDVERGTSLVLTQGTDPSWSVLDEIVFRSFSGLYRISANGEDETLVVDRSRGGVKARHPNYAQWSPDGEYFAYRVVQCCIHIRAEAFRVTRTGSGRTSLTRDLDWATPLGWR